MTHIRLHEPTFGEEEIEAVVETLRSTNVTSGRKVREFESLFGPNALMVNSGSSANLLAIATFCNPMTENYLRPGDEVIVSALSWSTTVWPIVQYGLIPVIVDIDPFTLNIDPDKVAKAIGPRTKAIMPVHVYGNPCDWSKLYSFGLPIIDDCCEALGIKPIFGDRISIATTFSFYFSHHITTLEGGIVEFNDPEHAEIARMLRAHGWTRDMKDDSGYSERYPNIDPKFLFVNAGYNLRASEIAAAIGLVQITKLDNFIEIRQRNADILTNRFERYGNYLRLQHSHNDAESTWFGFPITVLDGAPFNVRDLREYFEFVNIETRSIICGNIARQPGMWLWPHRISGSLDNADHVMRSGFSIGCHQSMTVDDCNYVGDKLDIFMEGKV